MSSVLSFKEKQFIVREQAILDAANALMAEKGFDLMSMDDVAAAVGVAKGSLYKHFDSKEALAAATMVRLLRETVALMAQQDTSLPAVDRLRSVLKASILARLEGRLPDLPSTNRVLEKRLLDDADYVAAVASLNMAMSELITAAKLEGSIRLDMPDMVLVLAVYARTCDGSLHYLQSLGIYSHDEIAEFTLDLLFGGIRASE